MTDKKKPTVQFGDYSKDFLDAFEKETQKLKESTTRPEPKTLDDQETQELLETLKQLESIEEEVRPVQKKEQPITESKMDEYLATLRDIDNKQKNIDKTTPIQEGSDLLGGAKDAVTQKQLRQATGELFARIQTSLASIGGGGLGTIMQGVAGTPSGGKLPMYSDSAGGMVWATVFGVGEAYGDSDALTVIEDTVDSAYINARVDGAGLDSAAIINLIIGTVDSDYVAARDSDLFDSGSYTTVNHNADTLVQVDSAYVQQRQLKYLDSAQIINLIDSAYVQARDSDGGFYTTADHDSDTLVQVDSAYIAARLPDLYDTPNHDSDTLVQVDSAYVQARQLVYGDLDVRELLAGDSGVFNIMPAADSTYDLGDSNVRWRDLWLSGNTIHLGSQAIKSGPDGVYANNKLLAFADSAYTTPQHDSDTLVQVDSAYVQLRVKSTDFVPEGVSNLYYETARHDSDTLVQVDSGYVQARQIRTLTGLDDTQIDSATIAADDFLQWNGTDWIAAPFNIDPGLEFNGSIDATVGGDSAPSAAGGALYVNSIAGVVGASYTGIAGDSIDAAQAIAYAESDGVWHILGSIAQASVVEVRQGNGISVDDSNPARPFVAINRTETDTWYLDSARVISLVDSAYVNLRADHYTTANHDSDTLVQVDSAYVNLRADHYTTANHDSDTLVQVDSAYVQARVDGASISTTDSLPEGLTNLYYTTARHDSDTLIQVDSAYVQARQLLGAALATVDSVAPTGPQEGQLWYDPTQSILFVRDSGAWDSIGGEGDFVLKTGDSMTGRLVAPSFEVSLDASNNDRSIYYFGTDSVLDYLPLELEAVGSLADPSDKFSWQDYSIESTDSSVFQSIAFGDGKFVAVANSGANRIAYSTDGARTWTKIAAPVQQEWRSVTYGGGKFVAVAMQDSGTDDQSMYSSDGINWTTSPTNRRVPWNRVNYGNGKFVAIGNSYTDISDDGVNWSGSGALPGPFGPWSCVAGGGGTFVAIQSGDVSGAWSSNNTGTWSNISTVTPAHTWSDVAYGNGMYVAVARDGATMYSITGVGWTLGNASHAAEWQSVKYGNGYWVAVASSSPDNSRMMTSTDGINWTAVADTNQGEWVYSTNGSGRFAAVSRTLGNEVLVNDPTSAIYFDGLELSPLTPLNVEAIIDSFVDSAFAIQHVDSHIIDRIETIVDSGYVAARVSPGTMMAGGRFIVGPTFAHDSAMAIPSSFVKSLWGVRNIVREDAGQYKINFDSANNVALQDSYSYIVTTTIDYNGDNPTASTRNIAVLDQDSDHFVLLMERADDGVNQDYTGSMPAQDDRAARITFSVIKAI